MEPTVDFPHWKTTKFRNEIDNVSFPCARGSYEGALFEIVESSDNTFHVMLSTVNIFRGVAWNHGGEVSEAEVWMKVIFLDVIFVIEGRLRHATFFA